MFPKNQICTSHWGCNGPNTRAARVFWGEGGHPPHPPSVLTFIERMLWRAKARHNMPKHVQAR